METATTPTAANIVADTAALESVFRALLADLRVDPRRLLDAAALVPTVERTATLGLFLVRSATTPDAAYHVQSGVCNCMDAQRRDARRCKHALAVAAFQLLERAEAEAGDPTPAVLARVSDEPIGYELTPQAVAALDPEAVCATCGDTADWQDAAGACVYGGEDVEGEYRCDCEGFCDDPDTAA
jgi:hypothetical protein